MTQGSTMLMWATSFVWATVSLGMAVAFLIVAFTVKRTRPDVFGLLVSSAALNITNATIGTALTWVLPSLMMRHASSDIADSYAMVNVLTTSFHMMLSVGASVLMLMALLRLAKPPFVDPAAAFAQGRYQ